MSREAVHHCRRYIAHAHEQVPQQLPGLQHGIYRSRLRVPCSAVLKQVDRCPESTDARLVKFLVQAQTLVHMLPSLCRAPVSECAANLTVRE